jgi:uncharacterized coiled-coil DUF342 family protein
MDTDALLSVSPTDMAKALLARRQMLKEQLPTVIRTLEAEEQSLAPKVERVVNSHRVSNTKVSELKSIRNESQIKAGKSLKQVKLSHEKLLSSGGMINLDPTWVKEKLLEELEEIEEKIQTSALDHKAEKKLIDRRKKLVEKNENWLKERRDSNPEMAIYIEARKKMSEYYREADKTHQNMLAMVKKAQPLHEKQLLLKNELLEIRRQLDRAKELMAQSERTISYWERRLNDGFGELDTSFSDLLIAQQKVVSGGNSSFARKKQKKNKKPSRGKSDSIKKSPKKIEDSSNGGEEE